MCYSLGRHVPGACVVRMCVNMYSCVCITVCTDKRLCPCVIRAHMVPDCVSPWDCLAICTSMCLMGARVHTVSTYLLGSIWTQHSIVVRVHVLVYNVYSGEFVHTVSWSVRMYLCYTDVYLGVFISCFVLVFVLVFKTRFPCVALTRWLSWTFLCKPGYPRILPASASQVRGVRACVHQHRPAIFT